MKGINNIFTKETNKIGLSSNNEKRIQSNICISNEQGFDIKKSKKLNVTI